MQPPSDPFEKSARTWGMLCHLAGLSGCFLPWFAHIAGPLLVWLLKRNDHPFIDQQGQESLNFQISMAVYSLIGSVLLALTIIGLWLIPFFLGALYLLNIVGIVWASIRSSEGTSFRYRFIFRVLR
ncbi:MAG: DUF4870 domain-containing protein [Verrucomicrobia bacterium]|nr:DUF4870 domain-containing protein [Verrucomicrobiota bacterium]